VRNGLQQLIGSVTLRPNPRKSGVLSERRRAGEGPARKSRGGSALSGTRQQRAGAIHVEPGALVLRAGSDHATVPTDSAAV